MGRGYEKPWTVHSILARPPGPARTKKIDSIPALPLKKEKRLFAKVLRQHPFTLN
jgi:hypothetical protein